MSQTFSSSEAKLTDRRDFVRSVAAELSEQEASEADVKLAIVVFFSTGGSG